MPDSRRKTILREKSQPIARPAPRTGARDTDGATATGRPAREPALLRLIKRGLLGLAALFLILVTILAILLAWSMLTGDDSANRAADPSNIDASEGGTSTGAQQGDGVTILSKEGGQAEPQAFPGTLVDSQSNPATGFAIDLGAAMSFSELSRRFADIEQLNAEAGFENLQPRAIITDAANGIEARLLVGPFDSMAQAQEICAAIALPDGVDCSARAFAGEVISRQ